MSSSAAAERGDPRQATDADVRGLLGFLLGAVGMIAAMYSTQAILPELSRDFDVSPSRGGLTVSAVVIAMAVCSWLWGPLSDRIGRPRAMQLASAALVLPSILVAVAPTFEVLVFARLLQGACLPGLLVVGAPYVNEVLVPRYGARAMGWYVASLTAGGLLGRVGVAGLTDLADWRVACGLVAVLPVVSALAMRSLTDVPPPVRTRRPLRHVITLPVLGLTAMGCAQFFIFISTFTFISYRLVEAPFSLSVSAASLIFLLWSAGALGPGAGRLAERVGWRTVAFATLCGTAIGVVVSLPDRLPFVVVGLALGAVSLFAGYTVTQLGLGEAAEADRGTASAFYFSAYYACGAVAGYVPGLAFERWAWEGVVACNLAVAIVAFVGFAVARRPHT